MFRNRSVGNHSYKLSHQMAFASIYQLAVVLIFEEDVCFLQHELKSPHLSGPKSYTINSTKEKKKPS